jgi:hypothetical protein
MMRRQEKQRVGQSIVFLRGAGALGQYGTQIQVRSRSGLDVQRSDFRFRGLAQSYAIAYRAYRIFRFRKSYVKIAQNTVSCASSLGQTDLNLNFNPLKLPKLARLGVFERPKGRVLHH